MNRGKSICNTLKSIRQKVADENGIDYKPVECHHKGECLGTCPACEAEVRYLDQRLNAMRLAGKAVRIAGVSLGIAALTACQTSKKQKEISPLEGEPPIRIDKPEPERLMGKVPMPPDTLSLVTTQEDGTEVFGMAENMPQFRGGQQGLTEYIKENLRTPSGSEAANGRVVVTFTIEPDGSVSNPKISKSLNESCDQEALRLVKNMPKWIPGKRNGKSIPAKFALPIDFGK